MAEIKKSFQKQVLEWLANIHSRAACTQDQCAGAKNAVIVGNIILFFIALFGLVALIILGNIAGSLKEIQSVNGWIEPEPALRCKEIGVIDEIRTLDTIVVTGRLLTGMCDDETENVRIKDEVCVYQGGRTCKSIEVINTAPIGINRKEKFEEWHHE